MTEPVLIQVRDAVATVTLNRPEALNALDPAMADALAERLTEAGRDPGVRAVVLAGAGTAFMAGGDIRTFAAALREPPAARAPRVGALIERAHDSILALRRMPKPVVVAARGAVAGFGMSLLMAGDLALAADDAVFTLAYGRIGASPDGGATFHLPRVVGLKRAMAIALAGDRFDAATAERLGLVNQVVPAADLDGAAAALAARLAAGPTAAFARTKELLNRSFESDLAGQLAAEADRFGQSVLTEDFAEGVAAFLEKRPPTFRGR